MEWVLLFIVSWMIFFLLVDWKKLHINVWAGILVMALQLSFDMQAARYNLYVIKDPVYNILNSSIFFTFGPVFVVSVLFAQYNPRNRYMTIFNVAVITILYQFIELLLAIRGKVVYFNWQWFDSLVINIRLFVILSWFSIVVLQKRGNEKV